jgi:inositol-phosphate phosphatase/L-galactose 1-phosphate phosphatase/histidinol-phosphatase
MTSIASSSLLAPAASRVATPTKRNNTKKIMSPRAAPAVGRRSTIAAVAASSPSAASTAAAVDVPAEYVTLANELVEAAGAISSKYFRTQLEVDDKNDASPVTIADKAAEAAMRAMVKARFPEHAIFGEEEGIELGGGCTS